MKSLQRAQSVQSKKLVKRGLLHILEALLARTVYFVFFLATALPVALLLENNVINGRVFTIAALLSIALSVGQFLFQKALRTRPKSTVNTYIVAVVSAKIVLTLTAWTTYFVIRPGLEPSSDPSYVDHEDARLIFALVLVAVLPMDILFTYVTRHIRNELK